MPRQTGNLKIEGTMNGMTFYKMKGKYYVRSQRNVSRDRILKASEFARTMENSREFGSASASGRVLRYAVSGLMEEVKGVKAARRVMKLMMELMDFDVTNKKGKRTIGKALTQLAAKAKLKGFEFNADATVKRVLRKAYVVDKVTGRISISGLTPMRDVVYPRGATHLKLTGAYAKVNFVDGKSAIKFSNEVTLRIDDTPADVGLMPAAVPRGGGTKIYLLHIGFMQEVNGRQYEVRDGKSHAMVVAEVV